MKKWLIFLFSFFLAIPLGKSINASLVYSNDTLATLLYDFNATLGSYSYRDNSLRNPNVYLKICQINESFLNQTVALLYASESGNITLDLLTLDPLIHSIQNNCTKVDIDISAFKALYPAYPFVQINQSNQTIFFQKLNQSLNGSYLLGISIDDVEKKLFLSVQKIFDDRKLEIKNASAPYLIISIVLNNQSIAEKRVKPRQVASFDYMFQSNEIVYVNGIPSLKVKVVPPCSKINETGYYYVVNESAWNLNDSCMLVENVSNIVIDFANKTIDGDFNETGSLREEVCGIIVKNSENVTLKDVRTHEFRKGICVFNSRNLNIFGTSDQNNQIGIYVQNSSLKIARLKLNNENLEIFSTQNSLLQLEKVYFATANVSAKAKDVLIRNVLDPPPDPPGLRNISQWINFTKHGESWVSDLAFHFIHPNLTGLLPKYIYKFDGIYANGTWRNQSWELLTPSYVDVANLYIFTPLNISNFSIFVPFAEILKPPPTPTPTPTPTPRPTPARIAGREEELIAPLLNLTLHFYEITVQQGESFELGFNLTNLGKADVEDVRVEAVVRKGWSSSFKDFDRIKSGETKVDKIYLKVYENEVPGIYYVPVKAVLKATNTTADVEILKVVVVPRKRLAKLDILEIPPYLTLKENSRISIGILVKNTGDYDLKGLRLFIENGEKCISGVEGSYDLKVGEEKNLVYTLVTKSAPQKCSTIFVFKTEDGKVVGMYPVIIKLIPLGIGEITIRFLPIILIIWTGIAIWFWWRRSRG